MTTSSDDKLYMTDDVSDRLSVESLTQRSIKSNANPETLLYDDHTSSYDDVKSREAKLIFMFEDGNAVTVDGNITSLSFGNGWLCSMSTFKPDVKCIVGAAVVSKLTSVRVSFLNVAYDMCENIDCTITGYQDESTITVSSDEARYV